MVDFYARGSDFRQQNLANLAPAIVPLPITQAGRARPRGFMRSPTSVCMPTLVRPPATAAAKQRQHPDRISAVQRDQAACASNPVEINPGLTVSQVVENRCCVWATASRMTVTVQNSGDVVLRQVVAEANHCVLGAGNRWSADALDPGEAGHTPARSRRWTRHQSVTISGRHKLGQTVSANATQPLAVRNRHGRGHRRHRPQPASQTIV